MEGGAHSQVGDDGRRANSLNIIVFILTVPSTMWVPTVWIDASPSQPVAPYPALQTRILPFTAGHDLRRAESLDPATMLFSSTADRFQSPLTAARRDDQAADDWLSMIWSRTGFAFLAQWNPCQEWLALAPPGIAPPTSTATTTSTAQRVIIPRINR